MSDMVSENGSTDEPAGEYEKALAHVWAWPGPLIFYGAGVLGGALLLGRVADPSLSSVLPTVLANGVAIAWWVRKFGRRGPSISSVLGPALGAKEWRQVLVTWIGALLFLIGGQFLYKVLGVPALRGLGPTPPSAAGSDSVWPSVCLVLHKVVLAPVTEELLYRGALFRKWRTRLSPVFAALASSVIFGVLHGAAVSSTVFGLLMVLLYVRAKTLWAPIAAHALNNAVAASLQLVDLRALLEGVDTTEMVRVASAACAVGLALVAWFVWGSWLQLGDQLPPDSNPRSASEEQNLRGATPATP